MRIAFVPAFAAVLALAACDQPKPREPAAPAGPAAPPAQGAPPARTIPAVAGPTPPAPAWATAVIGKPLREAYPGAGACKGNTDLVQRTYSGEPAGVQIHGWGWDTTKKARVERVVLVDRDARIVGAGEGGVPRPDVPPAAPEITDPNTGWNADAPVAKGALDAFGVVGDGAVCPLGHIEF